MKRDNKTDDGKQRSAELFSATHYSYTQLKARYSAVLGLEILWAGFVSVILYPLVEIIFPAEKSHCSCPSRL